MKRRTYTLIMSDNIAVYRYSEAERERERERHGTRDVHIYTHTMSDTVVEL